MAVLEQVRVERADMISAWRRGLFCALGDGDVDLVGFCTALNGYDGWVVIEQDRVLEGNGDFAHAAASSAATASGSRSTPDGERLRRDHDGPDRRRCLPAADRRLTQTRQSFGKYLGGSSSNVAVAAARYGHKAATITRTGEDPFGEFLHDALRGFGVDDRYVTAVPHLPTPVTFCEIFPPDDFPLYFYREPKAPDLEIHEYELDLDAIKQAKVFWATVTGSQPGAEPHRHAGGARGRRRHHCARPRLAPDVLGQPRGGAQVVREALRHVTVAVGNLDEWETAVGSRDPRSRRRRRARPRRRQAGPGRCPRKARR